MNLCPITFAAATVGRPVARMLQDGYTAELTRLCAPPHAPKGACSMMARACWRAARALGYRRLVTYTLKNEGGVACGAQPFDWLARRAEDHGRVNIGRESTRIRRR